MSSAVFITLLLLGPKKFLKQIIQIELKKLKNPKWPEAKQLAVYKHGRGFELAELPWTNRPFPSSPGPLFQNESRCSAFDMEIIFHSHANKTHLYKNGCAPSLILKVRVFGTRKWPIQLAVRVGLALGTSELQGHRSNHSATLTARSPLDL